MSSIVVGHSKQVAGFVTNRGGLKRIILGKLNPVSRNNSGGELYRTLKNNKHNILDADIVAKPNQVFTLANQSVEIIDFKTITPTTYNEGFSLIGKSKIDDAKIINYKIIDKNNPLLFSDTIEDETGLISTLVGEDSVSETKTTELKSKYKKNNLKYDPNKSDEDQFQEAEGMLDDINEINIDDILGR